MTRAVSDFVLAMPPRPAIERATDIAAVKAIAQAAIDVELFTIPLYMAALYSIQGMHQITGSKSNLYRHRLWPGPAPTAATQDANQRAFNIVFSVFIEEMLHLQLAANIASAIGVSPVFTSEGLQDKGRGWTCYGPQKTVIPHIVDLRDTIPYKDVKVNLGALTREQLKLFLAIERPEKEARAAIEPGKDYDPGVPFADYPNHPLPMFGTIGRMYQCYYDYLHLSYEDDPNRTLWDYVFAKGSPQRDLFNLHEGTHPEKEYPQFGTTVTADDPAVALDEVTVMMDAITDQGEGSELVKVPSPLLQRVLERYLTSKSALKADYPSYTDDGRAAPSAVAAARGDNDAADHFERFGELAGGLVDLVETWPAWFARVRRWTAEDFHTPEYDRDHNPYSLPSAEAIADAMNRVANEQRTAMYDKISQAAVGSLVGITSVLNDHWKQNPDHPTKPKAPFPYPSMVGSGDRMAICWALFGQAPDLSKGLGQPKDGLSHACQALDFDWVTGVTPNTCAEVEIFHACRGSNTCRAQGGCGFVQKVGESANCSFALVAAKADPPGVATDQPVRYSPPSDNECAGFGGCAAPISASQLFPREGTMRVFNFDEANQPIPLGTIDFELGEKVHDVAYRAYRIVMEQRKKEPPHHPPPPNDIRLVFPPST